MGDKTKLVLVLAAIVVLVGVIHSEPEDNKYYKGNVTASEILENISKGEPVEYDHVIVKGNLDLSQLGLPTTHIKQTSYEIKILNLSENQTVVSSPIRVNDSRIDGVVYLNNTLLLEPINFGGSIFNSTADFGGSNFNSSAVFSGSTFNSPANFMGSNFNSTADFGGSNFNSSAVFSGSTFNSPANFMGSTFNSSAIFSGSNYKGVVNVSKILEIISYGNGTPVGYDHVIVKGKLDLSQVKSLQKRYASRTDYQKEKLGLPKDLNIVSSEIRINDSSIEGMVNFNNTFFNNLTIFENTVFDNSANFRGAVFNNSANFRGAVFNNSANFKGTNFNNTVSFLDTKFKDDANFTGSNFFNYAQFKNSMFNSTANFKNTMFNSATANFENSMFNSHANFGESRFFVPTNFEHSNFSSTADFNRSQFNSTDFGNARFSNKLYLYGSKIDDFYINWNAAKTKMETDLEQKYQLYRLLKPKYEKKGYQDDVQDSTYEIKKLSADLSDNLGYRWGDYIPRYLYGYGMKPHYPVGYAILTIIAFGFIFQWAGIKRAFMFSFDTFLSGTGKIQIEGGTEEIKVSSDRIRFLVDIERILGLLFVSLLFLAIASTLAIHLI